MKTVLFKRYAACTLACSITALLGACGGGGSSDAATPQAATQGTQSALTQSQGGSQASGDMAAQSPSAPETSTPGTTPAPTSAPTPSPSPSPAPAPTSASIDYYGDSTVWGYQSGSGAQVANPAPAVFAVTLPQYHLATQYTVRNEGVNGTTACQLLDGSDGKHPAWDTQMSNSNAAIVIINHGINDEWKDGGIDSYKSCLASLAQKAKAHGKTVIFETPNPTRDSYPDGLDAWADAMRGVAAQQGVAVIDQYAYLKSYLNGASPLTICPDGLHPTEAVYAMKGRYAASVFASWPH
jgi:hypothetical protein